MYIIINVHIRASIDFTNTDLINSTLTFDDEQLNLSENLIDSLIIIRNARLPDGSFPYIDTNDLIIDGNAEQIQGVPKVSWSKFFNFLLSFI